MWNGQMEGKKKRERRNTEVFFFLGKQSDDENKHRIKVRITNWMTM